MEFNIGKVKFGGSKTVVIAEAGVNHLGKMEYAEKLIKTAKSAGADVIKFQTYKASKLTTKDAPRFWNWEGEKIKEGSQYDSYSSLDSFEKEDYEELYSLCKKHDIEFMSTPFDSDSADMLVKIGMKGFKIASCDITNLPFLRHVAQYELPVLLSTGASNLEEIHEAVKVLESNGSKKIGIMQCTLCYPTLAEDANLNAISTIKENFKEYIIGFSDHTLGNLIPSASILYGVKFIEKHYTFDKSLPDSADHWLSLDENEMREMVNNLRTLEKALGSSVKEMKECEVPTHKFARRSLVANKDLSINHVIQEDDLTAKRPGTGISPIHLNKFLGKKTKLEIKEDSLIEESWFE
tara:strand:- start:183 stop:1235 length:1053 start_codon:yes stop_codon:yes gene_type:complete